MKLLVLKETLANENRVAATPELIAKYQKLGFEVFIESGAGLKSLIRDEDYSNLGAKIIADKAAILPEIDVIISVQNIAIEPAQIKQGAVFIALFNPHINQEKIAQFVQAKILAFALEKMPRITRAQSMDVLSSQSNLAGYRAVIDAVYEMQKSVPMMITAAGTVQAAKFMILGAGVAGLQAIATAKRLGANVCAFDVRLASKEQVQSLGAKFIEVKERGAADSVYAQEMSEEYKKLQEQLIKDTIKNQDVVISTALIPGKKAPILISEEMVKLMKPNSIIVDLAAQNGGNCALTEVGKIREINGVKIIGYENFPSRLAFDASRLYSRNIFNFVEMLIDKNDNKISINFDDEIVKSTLIS